MGKYGPVNRRGFLKLAAAQLSAVAWTALSKSPTKQPFGHFPGVRLSDLPVVVQSILLQVPKTKIDDVGYLWEYDHLGNPSGRASIVQTQWNLERSNRFERLFSDVPWGIVLHWFGATIDGDDNLAGYLRGFDSLRRIDDYQTRTSAHFLVGSSAGLNLGNADSSQIGIVQTQIPDSDGTPFVASHLHSLDYEGHESKQQYFVRAFYQLNVENPAIRTVLTDFFDGARRDPNYRTIAIEITGAGFDSPGGMPSSQQIANVLSVVVAVMKRYGISIFNLLGHHEIELRKSDPGKNFIALIRYLVGIKALVENDTILQALVFGSMIRSEERVSQESSSSSPTLITQYFKVLRDYFVMVGFPDQVYGWETMVDYWGLRRNLVKLAGGPQYENGADWIEPFRAAQLPLKAKIAIKGGFYLEPSHHEGIDLFLADNPSSFGLPVLKDASLAADGRCIFTGYGAVCANGYSAIFRHHQQDGGEVLTIYGHLAELAGLQVGNLYRQGYRLGSIQSQSALGEGFLHFAVAFGATWDTVLKNTPVIPANVQPNWIRRRYLSPLEYIHRWDTMPRSNQLPR